MGRTLRVKSERDGKVKSWHCSACPWSRAAEEELSEPELKELVETFVTHTCIAVPGGYRPDPRD